MEEEVLSQPRRWPRQVMHQGWVLPRAVSFVHSRAVQGSGYVRLHVCLGIRHGELCSPVDLIGLRGLGYDGPDPLLDGVVQRRPCGSP